MNARYLRSLISISAAMGSLFAAGADAGEAETDEAAVGVVDELPLDRGFYVRTDATCATASNATTALLRRDGLYWIGSFCKFERIERTGPTGFRVQQSCGDLRASSAPAPIPAEWVVTDRTSFSFIDSEGWEHTARLCAQRDLPADYRDTEINDLIR